MTTPRRVFTFEGREVTATDGQSLAGALHAAGVRILTRSFKFRRPRGYTCGYGACGNCPLTVDGLPGVLACVEPVRGGEIVQRERGWPSADFDIFRSADLVAPLLTAGFQFRLFRRRPRLSHMAESVMAWIAGGGRMPSPEASLRARATRAERCEVDVLVVGGGLSGCRAAKAAAGAGANVMLVHRGMLGGRALGRVGRDEGVDDAALARLLAAELHVDPSVQILDGTAVARFGEREAVVVAEGVRYEVTARAIVIATGSYDVPAQFPGNDKPGVMLPAAARRLMHVEGVRPGDRAVVAGPRAVELAMELARAGTAVVVVVPTEQDPATEFARSHGLRVVVGEVDAARGRRALRSVAVRNGSRRLTVRCDVLVVDRGERPAEELRLQSAYVQRGDTVGAETLPPNTLVVGSAALHSHQRERDIVASVTSLIDDLPSHTERSPHT